MNFLSVQLPMGINHHRQSLYSTILSITGLTLTHIVISAQPLTTGI